MCGAALARCVGVLVTGLGGVGFSRTGSDTGGSTTACLGATVTGAGMALSIGGEMGKGWG